MKNKKNIEVVEHDVDQEVELIEAFRKFKAVNKRRAELRAEKVIKELNKNRMETIEARDTLYGIFNSVGNMDAYDVFDPDEDYVDDPNW